MNEYIFSDNDPNPESIFEFIQHNIVLMFTLKRMNYLVPCRSRITDESECLFETAVLVSPNGEQFIPAFTHPDEFEKWPYGREKAMLQTFDNLEDMVFNNSDCFSGIIINPFGEALTLRQEQIRQIDLVTGNQAGNVENLKFLRPEEPAAEVESGLKEFFRRHEEVYSAYLISALEFGRSEPHRILLIDFDGNQSCLFPEIEEVINACMPGRTDIELMKATYNLLQIASRTGRVLYKKVLETVT